MEQNRFSLDYAKNGVQAISHKVVLMYKSDTYEIDALMLNTSREKIKVSN